MSSLLCFICHNSIHVDMNADIREKYRELIGMRLCPDSHLCHICCHLVNKLWLFKSICLRRSLEYPVLFSGKGTKSLQNSTTETINVCMEEICDQTNMNLYTFTSESNENLENFGDFNEYVSLEGKADGNMLIDKEINNETQQMCNETDNNELDLVNDDYHEFDDTHNDVNSPEIQDNNEDEECNDNSETKEDTKEKEEFHKVILSVEEQKAELEAKRREDKYLEAEFKCYNCALGFLFKDTYQAHMMRHEESNGEHLCAICALRFASAAVLRAHCASHRERLRCARCGLGVRPRRTRSHRARCGPAAPLPCPHCGNTYTDGNGLQQHIKRFHLSKTSNKTYSCNVCGKSYNNRGAVRTHMIKHINKKFPCSECPSTFSSPYTLAQHRKQHNTVEEHRCETCNVSYKTRKSLLAHFRNSVSHQQTVFACPICSRPCPHRRALASHMQTVHTALKQHACTICAARYTSRKSLVSHMRRHEGRQEKVAVCHLCGASFKGNSKLNRHLRLVCEKAKLEEELSAFYAQE